MTTTEIQLGGVSFSVVGEEEETIDLEEFKCNQVGKYQDEMLLIDNNTKEIYKLNEEEMDLDLIGIMNKDLFNNDIIIFNQ